MNAFRRSKTVWHNQPMMWENVMEGWLQTMWCDLQSPLYVVKMSLSISSGNATKSKNRKNGIIHKMAYTAVNQHLRVAFIFHITYLYHISGGADTYSVSSQIKMHFIFQSLYLLSLSKEYTVNRKVTKHLHMECHTTTWV